MSNEFAILRGTASTAKSILRNISFDSMKRTTNKNGTFYYRGNVYKSLRIIVDTNNKIITFQRELKIEGGTRIDALRYNFNVNDLCKVFKESSFVQNHERELVYPFVIDADEHFMQCTIQDKFFPSHEDYVKIYELKEQFIKDVYNWITIRKEQRHASWLKWKTYKNPK